MLRTARGIGIRPVAGSPFGDNLGSGHVLHKLGFRPTGKVNPVYSCGRGGEALSVGYELELGDEPASSDLDPSARMAA